MDEETLARATEPFFTTKGVGKGTGLGLSMVHGMAEQIGGRLTSEQPAGRGHDGRDLAAGRAKADDARAGAATPADASRGSRAALTVLAVDDDALVLINTVAMLEDLGHTVLEAVLRRRGAGAAGRTHAVDLVITDQAMPRMTGLQLLRRRSRTAGPGCR